MEKIVVEVSVFELYLYTQYMGTMRIFFLFVSILFTSQLLVAQATFPEQLQADTLAPGILQNVNVSRDARLDKVVDWQIEKNKQLNGMDGFRVEIFFSSALNARKEARQKKVEFLSIFPDYDATILFNAPNFRVRVGNFRTKSEALKLFKKIQKKYPGAFIVPDVIDFPLLKSDKL
ncbi:MAG: SPOR domain-containing protein [Prolixibacteraceae bacterium]|nr:SPOR domain-containing protein [Prolixibacteraceae bacterium]